MGITFGLKLFGSAMVVLGIVAVLERLDEKGEPHEHSAGDTE